MYTGYDRATSFMHSVAYCHKESIEERQTITDSLWICQYWDWWTKYCIFCLPKESVIKVYTCQKEGILQVIVDIVIKSR